jgi:hypothetical protein
MKKVILLISLLLQLIPAFAFRLEYGNHVVINQPVYEDLYVAGGNITINAPIYGDLVVAGGTIVINDSISGDILLAGGNITFNGFVGDDIRCAGGNIRISRNVTGDLVITGGRIVIDQGVVIGGILAGGGDARINGTVSGNIRGGFGKLVFNGSVAHDIDCRADDMTINGYVGGKSVLAARTITIGNNAAFNNDIRYWTKRGTPSFGQSIKNGKAVYDPSLRIRAGQWYYLGMATFFALLWYLGMALLMILIIQYLFSTTMSKAAQTSFSHTGKSLLFGLLFVIGVPLAAVAAFLTVIGVPVGLLLLIIYIIALLLATVIVATVIANRINNTYNKQWNNWRMSFAAFGVFILLKLASLIPIAGWLIMLVMACIAFGSILLNVNWRKRRRQPLPLAD